MAKTPTSGSDETRDTDGMTPQPRLGLDRVVAIALLVVGGIGMFTSLGDFLAMPVTLNRLIAQLHAQMPEFPEITYTDHGLAQAVGMIIITLEGLIFGLTAWLTVRRISARKLAFWVPIVGWLVTSAVIFAGQMACLFSDPAFVDAFMAASQALQSGTSSATPSPVPTTPAN